MKALIKISFFTLMAFFILSCSGSKTYYKRGVKLEDAGLHKEASDYFLTALRKNPNNIDARIAIKKNGQKVLDEKLADFYQAYSAEDHKKAMYSYLEARDFHSKVNAFAEINFPTHYRDYFEESKDIYIAKIYEDAMVLKEEEKYEDANQIFSEILEIDPKYQDVAQMEKVSRFEPLYRKGKEAMANDQFRQAYRYFEDLLRSGNYKDASSLKQEALDEAAFTIAFIPVNFSELSDKQVADKFYGLVMEEVLKLDNPFIKLIDRSNIERILEEQKLALSGVVDAKSSAEAGKILGAKAVFSANIISFKAAMNPPRSVQQKGYQAMNVRTYNKATDSYFTVTRYDKVYFKEVTGSNKVEAAIRVNMSSSETAEILISDLISDQENDYINYAIYEGDYRNLYPGTWKSMKYKNSEDKVFTDFNSKRNLNSKFTTKKRNLRSTESMKIEMLHRMAREVARKIEAYDNSL